MARSKDAKAAREASKQAKDGKVKKTKQAGKPSRSKPSSLSRENVVESDDEEDALAPKATSISPGFADSRLPRAPRGIDQSTSDDDDEEEEEESSSSEDSQGETQQPTAVLTEPKTELAKVNGAKRKAKADESESSQDEETSSEEESEKEQRPPKKAKKAPSPALSSSSGQEAKEGSEKRQESANTSKAHESAPQASSKSTPAPPFEPPRGYRPLQTSIPAPVSFFTSSKLAAKQIWHITAPSSVPVKHITEVAMSSIQGAVPIIHHKGIDYILARNQSRDTQLDRVFMPSAKGYEHMDKEVDERFTIQQKLELPDLLKLRGTGAKGSRAAADVATASVSDIRPQPKGLKMRYKPPGFGKGDPGRIGSGSESESEVQGVSRQSLQFPQVLGMHGPSKNPDTRQLERKEKKKKKRQSEDVQMVDANQPGVNGTSSMPPPSSTTPRKKDKKKKEKRATTERSNTASPRSSSKSSASAEQEGKDERAERREIKKLKKERETAKTNGFTM